MNSFNLILIITLNFFAIFTLCKDYDLSIIGSIRYSSSVGRIPIVLIKYLQDVLDINFFNFTKSELSNTDLPLEVQSVIQSNDKIAGRVAFLTEYLSYRVCQPYKVMPDSYIKLAFSTIESTAIPQKWTFILNNYFDAVIVPDKFFVKVYSNCGVNIPIFVLPYPMDLDDFYKLGQMPRKSKLPLKETDGNNPFIFGVSASFIDRKNLDLVINAFSSAFKNNEKVKLVLHGFSGSRKKIENLIKKLQINNVEILWQEFDKKQYLNFLSSIDCYVLLSKSEGFSCTEKEALCLGIPCIVADNTALKSICKTGYVKAVKSDNPEKFYNHIYSSKPIGNCFNCSISDAAAALVEVYNNYEFFLKKANESRDFIYKTFAVSNLKEKYLTVFKPKEVLLGDKNVIKNGVVITTSKKLYSKYLNLVKNMLKVI